LDNLKNRVRHEDKKVSGFAACEKSQFRVPSKIRKDRVVYELVKGHGDDKPILTSCGKVRLAKNRSKVSRI